MAKARRRQTSKKRTAAKKKTNGKVAITDDKLKEQFNQLTGQVNGAKIALADAEVARMNALTRLSRLEQERHQLAEEVGKELLEVDDLSGWTFMVDTLEFVRNPTS